MAKKEKRRFEVNVPEFDPDIHALYINVGGQRFTFIADLSVMLEMQRQRAALGISDDEADFDLTADMIIDILILGLNRRHPDLTREDVEQWFAVPQAGIAIAQIFQEYLNDVTTEFQQEAGQGEALATRGSNSGPTRSTTSASRAQRRASSSRKA